MRSSLLFLVLALAASRTSADSPAGASIPGQAPVAAEPSAAATANSLVGEPRRAVHRTRCLTAALLLAWPSLVSVAHVVYTSSISLRDSRTIAYPNPSDALLQEVLSSPSQFNPTSMDKICHNNLYRTSHTGTHPSSVDGSD